MGFTAIKIVVPGDVVPWARAGGGRTMHRFTPKKQKNYMNLLRNSAQERMGGRPVFEGPVELEVTAFYLWPKSTTKRRLAAADGAWKTTKPDIDNIVKIIKDSFNGIVFRDDAQVSREVATKMLSDRAGLVIWIKSLDGCVAPAIDW